MSNTKYKLSYDEVRVIVIALVELKNQMGPGRLRHYYGRHRGQPLPDLPPQSGRGQRGDSDLRPPVRKHREDLPEAVCRDPGERPIADLSVKWTQILLV